MSLPYTSLSSRVIPFTSLGPYPIASRPAHPCRIVYRDEGPLSRQHWPHKPTDITSRHCLPHTDHYQPHQVERGPIIDIMDILLQCVRSSPPSDPNTRSMLAYSRLLICEALCHGGSGLMEYDRVFRRQLAINPTMPWNTLEPSLQAATILGQRNSTGMFCSICQECDHSANQCALAPLQQQVRSYIGGEPSMPSPSRPPRCPESLARICVSWNKGLCTVSGCSYRHICAGCHCDHKARVCPELPLTSEYKQLTQTPASSGIITPPAQR